MFSAEESEESSVARNDSLRESDNSSSLGPNTNVTTLSDIRELSATSLPQMHVHEKHATFVDDCKKD